MIIYVLNLSNYFTVLKILTTHFFNLIAKALRLFIFAGFYTKTPAPHLNEKNIIVIYLLLFILCM